jgi:hypothetical protein
MTVALAEHFGLALVADIVVTVVLLVARRQLLGVTVGAIRFMVWAVKRPERERVGGYGRPLRDRRGPSGPPSAPRVDRNKPPQGPGPVVSAKPSRFAPPLRPGHRRCECSNCTGLPGRGYCGPATSAPPMPVTAEPVSAVPPKLAPPTAAEMIRPERAGREHWPPGKPVPTSAVPPVPSEMMRGRALGSRDVRPAPFGNPFRS